jgi:hypothetical protein
MASISDRGIVSLFRADADGQDMFAVTVFDDLCDILDGNTDAPARLVAVMAEMPAHLAPVPA